MSETAKSRDFTKSHVWSLKLSAIAVGLALAGALGSGFELFSFRIGFLLLAASGLAAVISALMGLAGVVLIARAGQKINLAKFAGGEILALGLVGFFGLQMMAATGVPAIHDISTDTDNRPQFTALANRVYTPEEVAALGTADEQAALQRAAYADLKPLVLDVSPSEAITRAKSVAEGLGWEIEAFDAASGHLEAVDTTFWFRFKDNVVIRATAIDGKTVLDIRSVSRVGRSDVGKNAARIRTFIAAFNKVS